MACSKAIDGMVILGSINIVLKEKKACWQHFRNIFNYLKACQLFKWAINTASNKHLLIFFAYADIVLVFAALQKANNSQQVAQTGQEIKNSQ